MVATNTLTKSLTAAGFRSGSCLGVQNQTESKSGGGHIFALPCLALERDAVCSVGKRGCGEGRQMRFVVTAQEMLRRWDSDGTGIDSKYLTKEHWRSDHI